MPKQNVALTGVQRWGFVSLLMLFVCFKAGKVVSALQDNEKHPGIVDTSHWGWLHFCLGKWGQELSPFRDQHVS